MQRRNRDSLESVRPSVHIPHTIFHFYSLCYWKKWICPEIIKVTKQLPLFVKAGFNLPKGVGSLLIGPRIMRSLTSWFKLKVDWTHCQVLCLQGEYNCIGVLCCVCSCVCVCARARVCVRAGGFMCATELYLQPHKWTYPNGRDIHSSRCTFLTVVGHRFSQCDCL